MSLPDTSIRVITAPSTEPLTLQEAKAHLRVDGDDEDALISALIAAARQQCELITWRQLVTATLEWRRDDFPCGPILYLPRPPLQSVTAVRYVDLQGQEQTLSDANYYVDTASEPGRIALKTGHTWPQTNLQPGNVCVEFVAGRGASTIPDDLKAAMLLIIGHLYANREATVPGSINELPLGVEYLLKPHRCNDARVLQ